MQAIRYNTDRCTVELSVCALCEATCRSGDLGGNDGSMTETVSDASAVFSLWQTDPNAEYQTDVSLQNTASCGDLDFFVSGCVNGVARRSDGTEAIVVRNVRGYDFYAPPKEEWLAQMKCYAYFLAVRDGLPELKTRWISVHTDTGKTKQFRYRFSTEELRRFYCGLLKKLEPLARLLRKREQEDLPKTASAPFPYAELREGQEIMIREVYSAIKRRKRLFVEAPTGTGKTVSALYPAVRALGERRADKIFYLTAKTGTGREAYRAAAKLFEHGVWLRSVVITAKQQMCLCAEAVRGQSGLNPCNPVDCPFAKGYYDRVGSAIAELLSSGNGYPRQKIAETAKRYRICPYELSLDLSEYCDIVICDYNYVFDPSVYFRRYFSLQAPLNNYVFLIDEAHNLADRAREMYSATVRASAFESLAVRAEEVGAGELALTAEATGMSVRRLKSLCRDERSVDADGRETGFFMSRSPLQNLSRELEIFKKKGEDWLKKHREHPLAAEADVLLGQVRRYLCVHEYFGDGFLCYVEVSGGDVTAKIYCLDPSPVMNTCLNRASSSVLFSATLTPSEYFCDVLGGKKQSVSVSLPSPFDPNRFCVAAVDSVSTRAEDREKNYAKYASLIAATVSPRPGNYLAYFPSYSCLEGVRRAFVRKYPRVELVIQQSGMGAKEREDFLNAFQNDEGHLRIGFCVLGGAFSEGVDLPGSRLIGSIIFGVGLPNLSNERNMIREYFDSISGQGYEYAYTYPGMNHVLQAAGRVIRRDSDRGVTVLVDDRYATPKYRALFPPHWKNVQYAGNARSLAEIVRRFWEKGE